MPANNTGRTPRRGAITQREVVDVAAEVAEHGLAFLTMPAVAERLGVTPMALYHHVANKEHLLSLLMDSLLAAIEIPGPAAGPWDERLRAYHLQVVAAMTRYPGLSVEVDTPNMARLLDGYLQILLDAGFDPVTAGQAYTGLYFLAMGNQHRRHGVASPASLPPADAVHRATAVVANAVADIGPDSWHEFAFDVYLDGLRRLHRSLRPRRADRAMRGYDQTR